MEKHELKDSSLSIASSNRENKKTPDIVSISNLVADAEDIAEKIRGDQIQPTIKIGSNEEEDPVPGQPRSHLEIENITQDKSKFEMQDIKSEDSGDIGLDTDSLHSNE